MESGSSFQEKKEKVLGGKRGKPSWSIVLLIVVSIALGGVAYWLIQRNSGASPKVSSQPKWRDWPISEGSIWASSFNPSN